MRNLTAILITIMTSGIVLASNIPFQKATGKYKISGCVANAAGKMVDVLQDFGNGPNPCDTFDAVDISINANAAVVSLHKSADKIKEELKAVEGKSLDEINAVLRHSGMNAMYMLSSEPANVPGMETTYSETETSMKFSSITNVGPTGWSLVISLQIDSDGKTTLTVKDYQKFGDSQFSELNLTASISQ